MGFWLLPDFKHELTYNKNGIIEKLTFLSEQSLRKLFFFSKNLHNVDLSYPRFVS